MRIPRRLATNGYVTVPVPPHHHLNLGNNYAYEHRVVAEQMLDRYLRDGEIVHHKNGDKTDNRPENLEVIASIALHRAEHRNPNSKLRRHDEENPTVQCGCGCGESFARYDSLGRPRQFVTGHNMKARRVA